MAYRHGNRRQEMMFPPTFEELVGEDSPVRAYDAFVDRMDITSLGIRWEPDSVGNPAYDPRAMLKLLVYGYSYGIRSSRKLERACHDNVSFIWLIGGLTPDHKTVSEFRRKNKRALKKVLSQCARLCAKCGLIEGNVLFLDGSKMRANASLYKGWTREKAKEAIEELDQRIEKLLSDCEAADVEEDEMGSFAHVSAELVDKEKLRMKIESALEEMDREDKAYVNATDSDCVRVHSRQGSCAGYNAQIVVDDKNGLIVSGDVVDKNNDHGLFTPQIMEAQQVLERPCATAVADAGYADYEDLSRAENQGIDIIIPSQDQACRREIKKSPFDKSAFQYDEENDCYICPLGHRLRYAGHEKKAKRRRYLGGSVCLRCENFGVCTINPKHGRKLTRGDNEATHRQLERRFEDPDAKAVFRRRKMRAEHPFGHIKRNLGAGHFLMRGLEGVRAEWSLLATAFNLTRMISLLGVGEILDMLSG
jgi:transposase